MEATVADHLDMLEAELRSIPYSKAAHRRRLSAALRSRSEPAIERKHQNISAILIELGFPWIEGYKPLRNFQRLLCEVVADRISGRRDLALLASEAVERPAVVPSVDDILAILVAAPVPRPTAPYRPTQIRDRATVRPNVDFLALEARNRALGSAGEELVLSYEVARLLEAGQERLATRVERVSRTRGDGVGFDILSFEESGRERFIEVKTTAYGRETPFFVTRNEVEVSRERDDQYHLYRLFGFRKRPRLFFKSGPLNQEFALDAVQYRALVT